MKLKAIFATVTTLVVLFAGTAFAWEAESGDELYDLLASKSPYSRFVGEGYILGVIDTARSLPYREAKIGLVTFMNSPRVSRSLKLPT